MEFTASDPATGTVLHLWYAFRKFASVYSIHERDGKITQMQMPDEFNGTYPGGSWIAMELLIRHLAEKRKVQPEPHY